MAGRKHVLESWMLSVVEKAIMEGLPLKLVGGLVGVQQRVLSGWYNEGLDPACPEELKVSFAEMIDRCRAKAAQDGIALMKVHALGDYRAALELLKVSDPETWNTTKKVEVQKEMTVKRDLSALTQEELLLLQRIEEKITKKLEQGE